jgi:hypothetical protein
MDGVGSNPLCTFADALELPLLLAIVHSPQDKMFALSLLGLDQRLAQREGTFSKQKMTVTLRPHGRKRSPSLN